jgi:ABC-2 type transport system permease protein
VALPFIAASLALGLLFSTLAATQMQAMQMTFFFLMPSILLSGFMFPYDAMPVVAQYIAEILPATHFIRLIRGVFLRGAHATQLWPDILWLLGFTVIMMAISTMRFRKSLD